MLSQWEGYGGFRYGLSADGIPALWYEEENEWTLLDVAHWEMMLGVRPITSAAMGAYLEPWGYVRVA